MARFDGKLVIAAAAATNLMTALVAAGFAGSMLAHSLVIKTGSQALFVGNTSAVNASNGRQIAATTREEFPGAAVDLSTIWLFITAGDTIEVAVQSV